MPYKFYKHRYIQYEQLNLLLGNESERTIRMGLFMFDHLLLFPLFSAVILVAILEFDHFVIANMCHILVKMSYGY